MTTIKFTNEIEATGYGPRRVVDFGHPTKPRFRNNGYNCFTCSITKVTAEGKIPKNFETTEYHCLSLMGWVSARFRDGSTTPVFLHRNSEDEPIFSVSG